jgi:hypothetical protein
MKKQSKSTKEWIKSFVQEEVKSGTPRKTAVLWAKEIVDNLALLNKRGVVKS